jgi:DinB superfamily
MEIPGPGAIVQSLLHEYDVARRYTACLYEDLPEREIHWRPSGESSGIGWHMGHQAAVNHFMVRNLLAAEPSLSPAFDGLFDSATAESQRGELPSVAEIVGYRQAVAARTRARIEAVLRSDVGAPHQLLQITTTLLIGLVNHEYQHDCWIAEMRALLGRSAPAPPGSTRLTSVDGYWVLTEGRLLD